MSLRPRLKFLLPALGALIVAAGLAANFYLSSSPKIPEARELRAFVKSKPNVPIVFTSRSSAASFRAPADEGEGFTYPGTISWAASEGRLRLLDTTGKVYELTWGRTLPDGGTLIDVMSPSVSLDGKSILFAGRRASPDPGRWRIYRVNADGTELTQLTGTLTDAGCTAVPPLRTAADGLRMADDERKRLDYDDIDPTDLGPNGFAFASSRLPDLGRDHSRRATQIWFWPVGASAPSMLTGNRNNDRWPVLLSSDMILFSMWSRNREAISADLTEVRPVSLGGGFATAPTDHWFAARVMPSGEQFGYAVKSVEPVWRPRSLFNGRIAYMTEDPRSPGRFRLAQADWGFIQAAPSSLQPGANLPGDLSGRRHFGPDRDGEGRQLTTGCPSAGPDDRVLFSACPIGEDSGSYGLYTVADDWTGAAAVPTLLFDDPAFVDAEPVAVYRRILVPESILRQDASRDDSNRTNPVTLADGRVHTGPAGYLENLAVLDAIRAPIPWNRKSQGEGRIDPRVNPLVPPPPEVKSIVFYAAHRDRFDDPIRPRIPGAWEKLMVAPVRDKGELQAWIPSDPMAPTVLAGLDSTGKVAKWNGKVPDSAGRPAVYYAFAGDHYSATRSNGYHYCNGCHTGHTFNSLDPREMRK